MAAGEKTPLTRDVELGINASKAVVRTRLRIDNACCEAEATLAKKTLHAIAGVDRVSVNVVGRIAYATHRPHLVGAQALADALNEHNLGASVAAAPEAADNVEEPVDYKELAFVAALLLGLALGYVIPSLLVVVAVGGAAPLARDAVRGALLQKRLDVNALMLCAVLGALALKDTGEAATVGAVAAFARFAEAECLRRVRNALADASASEGAQVKATKGDGTVVDADSLIVGDVVIVRAGERVPCDGVVVSGKAAIDESALTGEPLPVHKAKGESVSGGTVATNGFVKIKVSATRAEDAAAELRRLVDEAQASSTRTQEVLQEFAAYFTPGVLVTAMLVALVVSLQRALVLLVVACPCALVLAAPVPAVASIGAGARRGILVKAASALEALAHPIPKLSVDAAPLGRDGQGLPAQRRLGFQPPKGLALAAPSVVLEGLARRGDGLADDDAFRGVHAVQVAHQRQPRPLERAARVLEFGARVAIYSIQAQRGAELLLVGVT